MPFPEPSRLCNLGRRFTMKVLQIVQQFLYFLSLTWSAVLLWNLFHFPLIFFNYLVVFFGLLIVLAISFRARKSLVVALLRCVSSLPSCRIRRRISVFFINCQSFRQYHFPPKAKWLQNIWFSFRRFFLWHSAIWRIKISYGQATGFPSTGCCGLRWFLYLWLLPVPAPEFMSGIFWIHHFMGEVCFRGWIRLIRNFLFDLAWCWRQRVNIPQALTRRFASAGISACIIRRTPALPLNHLYESSFSVDFMQTIVLPAICNGAAKTRV